MVFNLIKWDNLCFQNANSSLKNQKMFLVLRLIQLSRIICYVECGESLNFNISIIDKDLKNNLNISEDDLEEIYKLRKYISFEYFGISFLKLRQMTIDYILNKYELNKELDYDFILLFKEFPYLKLKDETNIKSIEALKVNISDLGLFNTLDNFFLF